MNGKRQYAAASAINSSKRLKKDTTRVGATEEAAEEAVGTSAPSAPASDSSEDERVVAIKKRSLAVPCASDFDSSEDERVDNNHDPNLCNSDFKQLDRVAQVKWMLREHHRHQMMVQQRLNMLSKSHTLHLDDSELACVREEIAELYPNIVEGEGGWEGTDLTKVVTYGGFSVGSCLDDLHVKGTPQY